MAFHAKLVTDCGVQHASKQFKTFTKSYGFEHVLIRPKHPLTNGEAEADVKAVKSLWEKRDKEKALLEYRDSDQPVPISAFHGT